MSTRPPRVSVIMPTHNRADLIGRAIGSVLNQTFHDFELIVVDDASTDNTAPIVAAFGDERIRYLRVDGMAGGASAARNRGIRQAQGSSIAFLDDDDELLPDYIERVSRALDAAPEQVGFIWCGVQLVRDTPAGEVFIGNKIWKHTLTSRSRARSVFFNAGIPCGTGDGLCVRATCFEKVGLFDEHFRYFVDLDLLMRLAIRYDFECIPQILVKRHRHGGTQLTDPTRRRARAMEQLIQKHAALLDQYPGLWADLHFKAGRLYYRAGDKTNGRRAMLKMIKRMPLRVATWGRMLRYEMAVRAMPSHS